MAASQVYDALGITDASQYMEGLMPKSTSMLPGAAVGAYATNSMLGAVAGATLNRALQPVLKDTPFESLSILPPLAPFVSDMTETAETTRAKYEGREHVPIRKGRFYMLSGTPYEGERIEQYRPNWYVHLTGTSSSPATTRAMSERGRATGAAGPRRRWGSADSCIERVYYRLR